MNIHVINSKSVYETTRYISSTKYGAAMTKKAQASLWLSHNFYIFTEYSRPGFEKFLRHGLIDIIGKVLRCNAKQTYCTPWMLHS